MTPNFNKTIVVVPKGQPFVHLPFDSVSHEAFSRRSMPDGDYRGL